MMHPQALQDSVNETLSELPVSLEALNAKLDQLLVVMARLDALMDGLATNPMLKAFLG